VRGSAFYRSMMDAGSIPSFRPRVGRVLQAYGGRRGIVMRRDLRTG